ncbi:MAG TPA: right-handed parallel beta-helix repeat-containing protein [Pyrinomonadaceae bacterium]|jgi:hypothetical protein
MSLHKSFALFVLCLALAACASAQTRQRQTAGGTRQTTGGGSTVEADRFPGADLGAKINAADRALGSAPGTVVARGGGRITTPVVVSERHTLRLMAGTYAPTTTDIPVLLKSGASLVGDGMERSILLESTAKGQFTVVGAHNSSRRNGDADADISVRDIQIKGANPDFNSAYQAVSLGNCKNCVVERTWLNGTRSIGVQLGGSGQFGNFAENSRVVDCLFTNVASQNLALANGRNITFENNRFVNPGQPGGPGSTVIDLEPNHVDDHLENIVIRNNFIDSRTHRIQAGNGIVVQSTSLTRFVGPVLIEGNTIYGGNNVPPNITNILSNGIYVFGQTMRDVTIRNNKVTRTGQSGLHLEGSHFTVLNNQFTDVGGGGLPGFHMADVFDSRIEGNSFTYTGVGPADATVLIPRQFLRNIVRNNPGMGFPANVISR